MTPLGMLVCRGVSRFVSEGGLEDGPWPLRALALAHLSFCGRCRRFARELALLGRAAREWSAGLAPVSAELKALEDRLISRLL